MFQQNVLADRLLFLAAVTNQATLRLDNPGGIFPRPVGFRLVASLGTNDYPFIGYIIESDSEIIIAFRGTRTRGEFLIDLEYIQSRFPYVPDSGLVNRGFLTVYTAIREQLFMTLNRLSNGKTLFITGHSLGGALAALAALDIKTNAGFNSPIVFTYASPRVGNPRFAAIYNSNMIDTIRVFNTADIIPDLPRERLGTIQYRHVGRPFPIHFENFSVSRNHQIYEYLRELSRLFPIEWCEFCRVNDDLCTGLECIR